MKPIFENIPAELKDYRQWIVWKAVPNLKKGKPDKALLHPVKGYAASSTNPGTWGTFEQAVAFCHKKLGKEHSHRKRDGTVLKGPVAGVGFVLRPPFVGIDLDGCIEQGQVRPWALEIIEMIGSYTEISPSGTGIRIFVKGDLPFDGRKSGKIEIYQKGRYLTVTGHVLPGMEAVTAYVH